MARPEEVAYNDKDVKMPARLLYFGIQPTHGAYVSPNGYSNLSPWPMYRLIGSSVVKEERGIAYFLTVQVSDGSPVPVNREANRLGNSLGPPIGHPAFKTSDWENYGGNEYIMIRVLRSADGALKIEGMIKGSEEETAAHPIEKDTYIGLTLNGCGRDEGIGDARTRGDKPSRAAMSNAELENFKTRKAIAMGVDGSSGVKGLHIVDSKW